MNVGDVRVRRLEVHSIGKGRAVDGQELKVPLAHHADPQLKQMPLCRDESLNPEAIMMVHAPRQRRSEANP